MPVGRSATCHRTVRRDCDLANEVLLEVIGDRHALDRFLHPGEPPGSFAAAASARRVAKRADVGLELSARHDRCTEPPIGADQYVHVLVDGGAVDSSDVDGTLHAADANRRALRNGASVPNLDVAAAGSERSACADANCDVVVVRSSETICEVAFEKGTIKLVMAT